MERPSVPKFGNWENKEEEVIPYTVYFDKARKGRGGRKMINPNDPEDNPDLFPDNVSDQGRISRKSSLEETPPSHQRAGSNSSTRPTRVISAGSDRSVDRSPLHPQYRGKAAGGGVASPAREMKSPQHSNHGNRTPGRTRMKPTSKDHGTPDRSGTAIIPPFGQWDENDPDSAENYTHIFDNASKERQSGSSNGPPVNSGPSYNNNPKAVDQGCCCFGWFRK